MDGLFTMWRTLVTMEGHEVPFGGPPLAGYAAKEAFVVLGGEVVGESRISLEMELSAVGRHTLPHNQPPQYRTSKVLN